LTMLLSWPIPKIITIQKYPKLAVVPSIAQRC
jgi:hypothetical protein